MYGVLASSQFCSIILYHPLHSCSKKTVSFCFLGLLFQWPNFQLSPTCWFLFWWRAQQFWSLWLFSQCLPIHCVIHEFNLAAHALLVSIWPVWIGSIITMWFYLHFDFPWKSVTIMRLVVFTTGCCFCHSPKSTLKEHLLLCFFWLSVFPWKTLVC